MDRKLGCEFRRSHNLHGGSVSLYRSHQPLFKQGLGRNYLALAKLFCNRFQRNRLGLSLPLCRAISPKLRIPFKQFPDNRSRAVSCPRLLPLYSAARIGAALASPANPLSCGSFVYWSKVMHLHVPLLLRQILVMAAELFLFLEPATSGGPLRSQGRYSACSCSLKLFLRKCFSARLFPQ